MLLGETGMQQYHTDVKSSLIQYRDQTLFYMHQRLPGPEGGVENRGQRPRFSTPPEGPCKRKCIGKQCLVAVIA